MIDWDEAMEQCGDDEEFLRELLGDLRVEIDEQVLKVDETLKVRTLVSVDLRQYTYTWIQLRDQRLLTCTLFRKPLNHPLCYHSLCLLRNPTREPSTRSCDPRTSSKEPLRT